MFRQILFVHWKTARYLLLPVAVATFGLPLVAVNGLRTSSAYLLISELQVWTAFFPVLAAAVGVVIALTAWSWDHKVDHVYALTLPLPRWEYVLLKMGAGLVLLLPAVATFWAGSLVATLSVEIPRGLHAYPHLLGLRFFLAAALAYGLLFALAAGTIRTTVLIFVGLIGLMVVVSLAAGAFAGPAPVVEGFDWSAFLSEWLTSWPGPFQVFTGNWMLIDV